MKIVPLSRARKCTMVNSTKKGDVCMNDLHVTEEVKESAQRLLELLLVLLHGPGID